MRSAVRDVKIPVTITICSGILAAVALLSMYLNVAQVRVSAQIQYRSFLDLYVFVAVIGFLMLVFLMPALTAGSISGERERQTLDIMMKVRGYHFAPTHAIQDNTPVENVIAMYNAAHKYGRY